MIKIEDNIILEIERDGLSAFITLTKYDEEGSVELNYMNFFDEIKGHILYGLNELLLTSILESKITNKKILIADGKRPVDGKDGSIKYDFEMEKPLMPKLMEDGTVDYRELDSINTVNKDDILAEIIPPIQGKEGIKVDGTEIPYKKGRTPKFKFGKNVILSFDGNTLSAEKSGLVELQNGKVSVSELLQLQNVDSSVGNIKFDGDVIVNKDILNGYSVNNTGSIEVKGAVEGGYINCDGDVLIRQGIQGYNRITVETKGNLGTRFIENAICNVKGNITSEAIMHSNVSSDNNILVLGKKGLIVGGSCRATFEIRARVIGSTMATTTVLEVGINPNLKVNYDKLDSDLKNAKDNLKKIEQSLNILSALKKSGKLDNNKEELYENSIRAQRSLNIEINEKRKELEILEVEMGQLSKGQIKVADVIYPGVKIVIGKSFMFIKDEMTRCTFYREDGEIRVGPY